MRWLNRVVPALALVCVAPVALATQDPWLPADSRNSAPPSQSVATNAPSAAQPPVSPPAAPTAPSASAPQPQAPPPPVPPTHSASSPATAPGDWHTDDGGWGQRQESPASKSKPETRWYGWQTLAVDALAIPVAFLKPEVGIGTYALGPPIVHWAHGNPGRGAGSLAIRVGVPALLGLAAASSSGGTTEGFGIQTVLPLATAWFIAVFTDAIVIAREPVPVEKKSARLGPVTLIPSLATTGKQTTFSLSGTF